MPPGKRLFVLGKFRSNKNSLVNGVFQGTTRQVNNDNFLWVCHWGGSSPILFPPMAARLIFIVIVACWFSSYWGAREWEREEDKLKLPQSSLFLHKVSHFSWMNASWIAANLWLTFRILKKLFWTIFASVVIAFMEKSIFGGPCSTVFTDIVLYKLRENI